MSSGEPASEPAPSGRLRRRLAPLILLAAALGASAMVERELPRDHDVVFDLGPGGAEIVDVEASWIRAGGNAEAQLTTRWSFAKGSAPERLPSRVRLADGAWEVEVSVGRLESGRTETVGRAGKETTRWSGRVNLEGTAWWKRDNLKAGPVILPVRESLR